MDAVTGAIYRKRERMSRYIDADELKKEVEYSMERNPHESGNLRSNHRVEHKHFMRLICSQPTADVEVVRHAHWIVGENGGNIKGNPLYGIYVCSNCKNEICEEITSDYCPHCGAKMDESVEK